MFGDAAQTLVNPAGTPSGSNTQQTGIAESMPRARASAANDFSRMLNEVW